MSENQGGPQQPYWFNVKYGEDESALFNADCWAVVLLDYIKERCGYNHYDEPIDLVQLNNTPMNVREVPHGESALTVLEPEATYILVKVVAPEVEGGPVTLEQLWTPPEGYEAPPDPAAGKKK